MEDIFQNKVTAVFADADADGDARARASSARKRQGVVNLINVSTDCLVV